MRPLPPAPQEASFALVSIDEMVDGRYGIRPQWRGLLGVLTGLGYDALMEHAQCIDRVIAEEGVTSLLLSGPVGAG